MSFCQLQGLFALITPPPPLSVSTPSHVAEVEIGTSAVLSCVFTNMNAGTSFTIQWSGPKSSSSPGTYTTSTNSGVSSQQLSELLCYLNTSLCNLNTSLCYLNISLFYLNTSLCYLNTSLYFILTHHYVILTHNYVIVTVTVLS